MCVSMGVSTWSRRPPLPVSLWGSPGDPHPSSEAQRGRPPTFLLAAQQQLVFVRAGVVVALHLQAIVGLEALRVLAVPQELLVVPLQAAQDLPHLLGRQRAELGAGTARSAPVWGSPGPPRPAETPPGTHRDVCPGLDQLDVPGQVLPGAEAAQVLVQLLPQRQQLLVGALQPVGGCGVTWGSQRSPGGAQGHRPHLCTASRASLLGGGRRKQTEGTTASVPAALCTRHCCGCAWFTRAQVSFLCSVTCGAGQGGQGGVRALLPLP